MGGLPSSAAQFCMRHNTKTGPEDKHWAKEQGVLERASSGFGSSVLEVLRLARDRITGNRQTPARPKVLLYSHNMEWQGAPNSLFELATGIQRYGRLQPVVMTPAAGPLNLVYEAAGIAIAADPGKGNTLRDESTFEAYISKLARQFRRIRPDIVHANTLQSFPAVIAAKRMGIPVLFNVRESENPKTYFDYLPAPLRQHAYDTYDTADTLVFVSQTTRARWDETRFGSRSRVINNGIDADRLRAAVGLRPCH